MDLVPWIEHVLKDTPAMGQELHLERSRRASQTTSAEQLAAGLARIAALASAPGSVRDYLTHVFASRAAVYARDPDEHS